MKDLEKIILKYKEEAIRLLQKLISYKSVLDNYDPNSDAPFGEENKKVLEYLLTKAQKDGFITKNIDNYAGHIEFGTGQEILGILAHLDVVPVEEKDWQSDPFTLTLRNGKMYARGAIDDKGPLVAAYIALKILRDSGFKPNKKIRIIVGCDEESGSRCLEHYLEHEQRPSLAFSPDADFPLIYGEKGMLSYDIYGNVKEDIISYFSCGNRYNVVPACAKMKLKVDLKKEFNIFLKEHKYQGEIKEDTYIAYGVASHAMCPEKGVNAGSILFEFLKKYSNSKVACFMAEYFTLDTYGKKLGYACYDEDMKHLTSNLAIIEIKQGKLRVGVNCRVPIDCQFEVIEECVSNAVNKYGYTYKIISKSNRHYVDPKSSLVKNLMEAYQ